MNKNNLKVGDRIIDSDQVYVIFKIEGGKIFYQQLEGTSRGGGTGSIPMDNLDQACIRPLMTKSEVNFFFENLDNEKPLDVPVNANAKVNNGAFLKDILYLNNPNKTAKLLIHLSLVKSSIGKLSYLDQSIFDQGLNHLCDEIAIVTETSKEKIREKILKGIER